MVLSQTRSITLLNDKMSLLRQKKMGNYLVIGFVSLLWLIPIIASLMTAFKTPQEFLVQKFWEFPNSGSTFFANLDEVLDLYRLHHFFLTSLFYAAVGGGFACIFGAMAGFSIVRLKPRYAFTLFFIIYSGTVFPFQMYLIPLFDLFNATELFDTKIGLLSVYIAICLPFSVFVFRGYYATIPQVIEDAAKLDGCGPYRSFCYIFLPQSKAPFAIVALFQMTFIWNDLLFGMVLTLSEEARPIMVALATMSGGRGGSETLLMTGVIFTSIPTILLFLALRKYFIKGMGQILS